MRNCVFFFFCKFEARVRHTASVVNFTKYCLNTTLFSSQRVTSSFQIISFHFSPQFIALKCRRAWCYDDSFDTTPMLKRSLRTTTKNIVWRLQKHSPIFRFCNPACTYACEIFSVSVMSNPTESN